ncbi:MAG: winged helix-turn-helix transcriptional regulator [Hahellaceae bacterium]|nr:winged helix-turn-helix transcriptional regulator [Hahellaceae bacterium]
MSDIKTLAKAFKALSNPNRLQIYVQVMKHHQEQRSADFESGCCLADFMSCLNVGAPTVSHHLKELVNADLITVERNGKYVNCFLNESMQKKLQAFLQDT